MNEKNSLEGNSSEIKQSFISQASIESQEIKNAFNALPKILQFLSLSGLFINSFLSVAGIANSTAHKQINSSDLLFLRGVNAINGPSGFFADVLNFSFKLQNGKKKIVNKDSKKSLIVFIILIILFLIRPLSLVIADLLQKQIGQNNKYYALISSSISTIQSILSILIISFFALSVISLLEKIQNEKQNKLKNIVDEEERLKFEKNINKGEKRTRILLISFSVFIVFSFSIIHALILKKIAELEKIANKTLSQRMLFNGMNYFNHLAISVIVLLGIYLAALTLVPIMRNFSEKIIKDKKSKVKKKTTLGLAILSYGLTVGLFALSNYLTNIFNSVDTSNITKVFGYDVLKTLVVIAGVIANGLACYFIFQGISSFNDSEKLLNELLDKFEEPETDEEKNNNTKLADVEKAILRNKIIGGALIISGATGVAGLLSTLIYAEVKNLDKISNFIQKPEFLAGISMLIATFILLGISFYGKMNFLEYQVKEFNKSLEISSSKELNTQNFPNTPVKTSNKV